MKQQITKEQVTENIQRIFADNAGKNGTCIDVYSQWPGASQIFLMNFPGHGIIAIDEKKQVFVKWPGKIHQEKMSDYENYCEGFSQKRMLIKKQFKGMIFMPFIFDKKTAGADVIKQRDQFLECVGYERKIKSVSDLTRLQKLVGKDYVNFYKLIQELQSIRAYMKMDILVIEHMNGRFSFPINNIVPNDEEGNRQVRDIFCNLVGLSISSHVAKIAA